MELIQEAHSSKWTANSNHNIRCFTKGEILRITNHYRTILGRGSFGEVYEGVLEDQTLVAVKRFTHNVKESFGKELTVHREINHRNVVRLIGYCDEENAITMVTEYISNGNLSDVLHTDNTLIIPLHVRLAIATECAEALAYMHSYMYTRVIHGDIKPSNILLDGNFHAKISDFGLSRLVNTDKTLHTENVMGSIGYMDPLFARDGCLTVKSDVYSFGVVLLELITRKKGNDMAGGVNIVFQFTDALARGVRGVREMFDTQIGCKNNSKILEGMAKLAGECLRMGREKRPEMIDVAERLRVLRKASHQYHHGQQQRVDMLSCVSKSRPILAIAAALTIPAKTLSLDLCRHFTLLDIKVATNNFDYALLLGRGAFGSVYRGEIDGGATKIEVMSKLRHDHLVPLIGYCDTDNEMILVYNYMVRGDLHDHIYRTLETPLTWRQRLEISISVARGLCYLHQFQIIHCNVKTKNILLDEAWVAKISDTVAPKSGSPMSITTFAVAYGTPDYLDPEYMRTGWFTDKSDVYSFGVVLLEVLCAKPVVDRNRPFEQVHLVDWALICKEDGNLDEVVDPYLKKKINSQCLDKFFESAEKCVAPRGIDRPSMSEVLSDLEYALQLQQSAEVSGSSST
ncbi:hypothetical protein ACP4OV_012436 [Aristida adscensionis]